MNNKKGWTLVELMIVFTFIGSCALVFFSVKGIWSCYNQASRTYKARERALFYISDLKLGVQEKDYSATEDLQRFLDTLKKEMDEEDWIIIKRQMAKVKTSIEDKKDDEDIIQRLNILKKYVEKINLFF